MAFTTNFLTYLNEQNKNILSDRRSIGPCSLKINITTDSTNHWFALPVNSTTINDGKLVFASDNTQRVYNAIGDQANDVVPNQMCRSDGTLNLTYVPTGMELWGNVGYGFEKLAYNTGLINPVEGDGNPYLDSNDTVGGFSYTIGFDGYRAGTYLGNTISNISDISGSSAPSNSYVPSAIYLGSEQPNEPTISPNNIGIVKQGSDITFQNGKIQCTFDSIASSGLSSSPHYVYFVYSATEVVQVDTLASITEWISEDSINYTFNW